MTFEEFHRILTEEGLRPSAIDKLWATRPSDTLDETRLRSTARKFKAAMLGNRIDVN